MNVNVDVPVLECLRALGEPLRWRIAELLAGEELCVCHLVEELGAPQSLVSHHLRVLRDAGLVEAERFRQGDGAWFRRELNIPAQAFVVGHAGRLAPEKNLLFLAQVDAGKLNFELRPVDLEALVADCVEASLPAAAAKEIELTAGTQELPVQLQAHVRLPVGSSEDNGDPGVSSLDPPGQGQRRYVLLERRREADDGVRVRHAPRKRRLPRNCAKQFICGSKRRPV